MQPDGLPPRLMPRVRDGGYPPPRPHRSCHCQPKSPQFWAIEISPDLYILVAFSVVTRQVDP